ncbi:MAG TPA: CapA family protein [Candidatus Fimivivens faecavium]|nr:CapA family protein [Candidatus Fimivivens faecavium]
MTQNVKLAMLLVALCAAAVGLFSVSMGFNRQTPAAPPANASSALGDTLETEEPEPLPPATVRFVAAGDNLIHDNIYSQARARAGGEGFDFTLAYQGVEKLFVGADIAFINQETPIAESVFPLSGYPMFNSPEAVGDYVEKMGFNVVNHSNNHMFDMGERGLIATLDFWAGKPEILAIGAWRTEEDMKKPLLVAKNGITFGFVPMTEHTNGLSLPKDSAMRYVKTNEYDLMKEQVELAKANADFVVVSAHWGTENSTDANDNQRYLAQMFADWGVDLVLGHHSHTLQPMEWLEGADGNRTLVAYSVGNFISGMLNPQNMLGGVLDIDVTKDGETGEVAITRAKMIPIVTQYDYGVKNIRVYAFEDYTPELAREHGMNRNVSYFGLDFLKSIYQKNIPEEFWPFQAA